MYVDMRTQTWPCSPGINVAAHKSQSCCLSWCSCFAECRSQSALMSGGAGGCAHRVLYTAAGCTHVFALLVAVNLACLLQNSTCTPAPFETFLWLALRHGPIFGAVGLHAFCLPSLCTLHVKPASWHQAQENMNERCNLSQLNALFAEGKTHIPWAQNWITNLEAGLFILVLWPHFWVKNLALVLGSQNTNRRYSIRAASVLQPPQADSSTYP